MATMNAVTTALQQINIRNQKLSLFAHIYLRIGPFLVVRSTQSPPCLVIGTIFRMLSPRGTEPLTRLAVMFGSGFALTQVVKNFSDLFLR